MSGSADLAKAINTVWDSSGLNAIFTALWPSGEDNFPVLHDQEAAPGSPFPYCVMELSQPRTITRMSKTSTAKWEIRDVNCQFKVHARLKPDPDQASDPTDVRSPKEIASYLANEILKVFGGHPTQAPTAPTLDNGNFLIAQYDTDYSTRTGDDEYRWTISYNFRLDVPVMVSA